MPPKKTKVEKEPLPVLVVLDIEPWKVKILDAVCTLLRISGDTYVMRLNTTEFTTAHLDVLDASAESYVAKEKAKVKVRISK